MALTQAQLDDLVEKFKVYARISDDDPQYHADGIAVFCSATDARVNGAEQRHYMREAARKLLPPSHS